MNDFTDENRVLRLANVIRTSVDEMMCEKMAVQFQKKKISPTLFSNRLLQVLEIGLKCEREQYIREISEKLHKVEQERDQLKKELANEKRRWAHENTIISTDKAFIQRRYETLDEHYKVLGWRKDMTESSLQEQIQIRDKIINLQRIAINKTQKCNNYLKSEIKELNDQIVKNTKIQMRALKTLKNSLFEQFHASLTYFIRKQKKKDYRHVQIVTTELKAEKMAHDQLKGASQLLLDSVWNISPRRRREPKVTLEELPRRISEVHTFIQNSVEDQKEIAIEAVKKDLSTTLPEISVVGEESVIDAVSTVISDRAAEKEAEFQSKLRAADKREEKLKKKLQSALIQIQNLKKPAITPPQYRYVDEFQEIKDDWDQQKEILDMRMRELSQGMSSSLRSPLSNSIFNTP
ncbi:paramyosin [Tritrichomonas foetus]|uniref:Paramyosin n=1 Tax=Tritrichomonas foetus TaxID=1144522 RepID=A0A1J4JU58_9EUKA|nr:paramyosin [Tritrichomonas foetus]|eukprot:OHT01052.1 paramyosin [Tritrichomonas foetus]